VRRRFRPVGNATSLWRGRVSGERAKGDKAKTEFYRALSAAELVRLLRQGNYDALQEFTARYAPLLVNYVERAGFRVADVETVAVDLLTDIATSLIQAHTLPKCSMETYVVRSFRYRLASLHRQSGRDVTAHEQLLDPQGASGCSQGTMRSSAGPEYERPALPPVLQRLSSMLDEGLTREESDLLGAVSEYASQSDIAEWLGVSHAALRKQLERLRRRLRLIARRYIDALTERERAEIRRFFARVDAIIEPEPTTLPRLTKAAGNDR
jgi:DNA-directed RNA polymerase specialized sigma24 family protein